MAERPDIAAQLGGTPFRDVEFFDSVESTNAIALERASAGADTGLVVIADRQTKGRGRHGRSWFSPAGSNIYLSILLRPRIAMSDASMITIMTGVAVAGALREATGLDVRIKWPNDIILSHRKLGGILTETRTENATVTVAVVGIGLNINLVEQDLPSDIKDTAISLRMAAGGTYARDEIVLAVLKTFHAWYDQTVTTGPAGGNIVADGARRELIAAWKALDITLGKRITVTTTKGTIRGTALDIEDSGMLVVKTDDGNVETIHTGDVALYP